MEREGGCLCKLESDTVDREIFALKNIRLKIFALFYFRRLSIPEM